MSRVLAHSFLATGRTCLVADLIDFRKTATAAVWILRSGALRRFLAMDKTNELNAAAMIAEQKRRHEQAVEDHPVVSQEEWLRQRLALLDK